MNMSKKLIRTLKAKDSFQIRKLNRNEENSKRAALGDIESNFLKLPSITRKEEEKWIIKSLPSEWGR